MIEYDKNYKPNLETLPDPQNSLKVEGSNVPIQKVGIRNFKIPFSFIRKNDNSNLISLQTKVSAYVCLEKDSKGINMSRLSRILYENNDSNLSVTTVVGKILKEYKEKLNSNNSYIKLGFDYPMEQKSLRSNLVGIKYYKCNIEGQFLNDEIKYFLTVDFDYSSTCPCSQELSEHAREERNVIAAPHSQRSTTNVKIQFDPNNGDFLIEDLIFMLRDCLKTETQLLVKREDEQAFAELSGIYPKFVEDAARLIFQALDNENKILDFVVVCNHYESLHSSDAVSVISKGVENGLK